MKRINLLTLGMVACSGLTAQAQIVNEDFNAEQTKQPTEQGYYKFVNVPPIGAEGATDTWKLLDGVLNIDNDQAFPCDNQKWQRAIKFFHLPIKAGKLYKVSFDIKATETPKDVETQDFKAGYVDVKLMQGDENADICILGANGEEQRANFAINAGDEIHFSETFYYADEAKQMAKYEEQCAGKENYAPSEYFVNINVYNPGKYTIDNIVVEEVSVKAASYANNGEWGNISVDFGKPTNIADLVKASADPGTLVMPEGCVVVKDDAGEDVALDAVELRPDGKLYIFGTGEIPAGATVQFTNPSEEAYKIVFLNDPEGSADFEIAPTENDGDAELAAMMAWSLTAPELVTSVPSADSFNHPEDMKEFTFTFDHEILTSSLIVKLDGNALSLKEGTPATAREVTVVSASNLTKGMHAIEVTGVTTDAALKEEPINLSFEVGKHQIAKTTYTKIEGGEIYVPGGYANNVPAGWTVVTNNEKRENLAEGGYGSGGRAFDKAYGSVIYFRAANGEEGSVTTTPVTLAAGATQLRALVAAWKNENHDCNVQVLNAADEVVAEKKITGTSNAENGDASFEFAEARIDFEAVAGEYHLKFVDATLNGNGLAIKGGQFYSVSKSEGESVEVQTLAEGLFGGVGVDLTPQHGTGWKMWNAAGVVKNAAASCGWAQPERDVTGGSRCNASGQGSTAAYGGGYMYFSGGGEYATYGAFDNYTNRDPNDKNAVVEVLDEEEHTTPEKVLTLDAAKYQVSYTIGNWNAGNPLDFTCEIYTLDAFKSGGDPVYKTTNKTTGNKQNNGDQTTVKFFFDAPEAGRYVVKMIAGAEMVFGNFKLESTVSLPIQYAQMLDAALEPLVAEQGLAHASETYMGDTRDEVDATIISYSAPDFHTVAEYQAAIDNVAALVKKMAARRTNIDTYPGALEGVKAGLEAAQGTKYEALEQFPIVKGAYEKYVDVDYIALSDEALAEAVGVMGNNGTLLKNMVDKCVPLLTRQINDLVTAILDLDENASDNEFVVAAGEAVSDDQALVANLKKLYTAKLYKKFAETEDPFHKTIYDPETMDSETIDIEYPAKFLIQNPMFYCVEPLDGKKTSVSEAAYPGWNIQIEKGNISPIFTYQGWGGVYPTDVEPVMDVNIRTFYGEHTFDVQQNIDNIPVALYNASIVFGADGQEASQGSYAFCGETKKNFEGDGNGNYSRDNQAPSIFEDVTPVYGEDDVTGAINLGVHMNIAGSFGNIDNANLQIVAKAPGFDYEEAARKLGEEITAAMQIAAQQQPAGAPVKVAYFGLDGAQGAQTGVVIKVETWANGFQKITKMAK